MLWLKVLGAAAMPVRRASRLPLKSVVRTSTAQPGTCSLICRITAAKIEAPPSESSSRLTLVITACSRAIFLAAAATRPVGARACGLVAAHLPPRVGDAVGLVEVELGRLAREDCAEAAAPRAYVAEDHERRRPVVPALPDVRAAGLLAARGQDR